MLFVILLFYFSSYQGRGDPNIGKGMVRRCSASGIVHDSRGYHQSNGVASAAPSNKHSNKGNNIKRLIKHTKCLPYMDSEKLCEPDIYLKVKRK